MVKIFIVLMFLGVVASLFSGLFFLHRDRGAGTRTVRALTLRVGLSIGLFALLLLSYSLGWVSPN